MKGSPATEEQKEYEYELHARGIWARKCRELEAKKTRLFEVSLFQSQSLTLKNAENSNVKMKSFVVAEVNLRLGFKFANS